MAGASTGSRGGGWGGVQWQKLEGLLRDNGGSKTAHNPPSLPFPNYDINLYFNQVEDVSLRVKPKQLLMREGHSTDKYHFNAS